MDKFAFRRGKLKALIDTNYGGVMAAFARATGIDPTYVSRHLYEETKPGFKRISDEIIEKIDKVHPLWLGGAGKKNTVQPQLQLVRDPILDDLAALPKHEQEIFRIQIKAAADIQRAKSRAATDARQEHGVRESSHDPTLDRRRTSR